MTTCPSGVNYMHLVDHARAYIEETLSSGRSPDRLLRWLLARVLPYPRRIPRWRCRLRAIARGRSRRCCRRTAAARCWSWRRAPPPRRRPVDRPQVFPARGQRRARVALLTGCAQPVLAPQINEATIRLLTRLGVEVVVAEGGAAAARWPTTWARSTTALRLRRGQHRRLDARARGGGLDAIVINASGCGTTVKDYGFMLREDAAYAAKAARDLGAGQGHHRIPGRRSACRPATPRRPGGRLSLGLLAAARPADHDAAEAAAGAAGFTVQRAARGHLCCGSAGTYNILQPEIAGAAARPQGGEHRATAPEVIATGNIGCITQIARAPAMPVVHTVELLDWATGGPRPVSTAAAATDSL